MLEQMRRVAQERSQAQSKEQDSWQIALAELHDKSWISMQETFIKNQTLLEEWEEEREGIQEGVRSALERLDPIEEGKLEGQLQSVDARLADTKRDNLHLADLIDKVEKAFEPVLKALFNGTLGRPLTPAEKIQNGLTSDDWAYWLGHSKYRLVKDLKPEVEAFALRQRQHRLEQLRKSHKRDFEMIQRMKERLTSEANKVEQHRRSCLSASPAKMIQSPSHVANSSSNLENAQSPGRRVKLLMCTSPSSVLMGNPPSNLAGKSTRSQETALNFGADQNKRARKD